LPRGLGTFPAGSAVRVKSRFALYSVRAAVFDARSAGRFAAAPLPFAAVLTLRFAAVPELRFADVPEARFAVAVPEPRFTPRFAADFLARAGRVLVDGLLVAMPGPICQEHAPAADGMPFRGRGADLWLLSTNVVTPAGIGRWSNDLGHPLTGLEVWIGTCRVTAAQQRG